MSTTTPTVKKFPIAKIQVEERRAVAPERVEALKRSIQATGLLQPIAVTKAGKLLFGRHRLEACKAMGWKMIPVIVHELDDLHAELAEIDENLMRSNLTAVEEAEAIVRRGKLFEQLYPETKHGGSRRRGGDSSSGQNGHLNSFATTTAEQIGRSARSVRRVVTIGKRIPKAQLKRLKGTAIENTISELDKLGRLDEKDQPTVVDRLVQGAESVAKAIRKIEAGWSAQMRATVIDKLAMDNLDKAADFDLANKDAELQQLAEVTTGNQRAVAKLINEGKAHSVANGLAQIEAVVLDNGGGQETTNPLEVYRQLLSIDVELLRANFDDIVGKAIEPDEAGKSLERMIDFCKAAMIVEKAAPSMANV